VAGRDFASVFDRERRIGETSRAALIADLRAGIARKEVLPCDPERIVSVVLALISGVLVHQVLGIARPDGVIEELAERIIEPLRPKKRKPRKRS
jgi:hypothetical protein